MRCSVSLTPAFLATKLKCRSQLFSVCVMGVLDYGRGNCCPTCKHDGGDNDEEGEADADATRKWRPIIHTWFK